MRILDATAGGRHLWYNKTHPMVTYVDQRVLPPGTIPIRPNWEVKPDVCASFTDMPFEGGSFDMVVWDPPHIIRDKPSKSFLRLKYGELKRTDWQDVLRAGFNECMRCLKNGGFLHFKWAESSVPLKEVLRLFPQNPLFKNKGHVTWSVFLKGDV